MKGMFDRQKKQATAERARFEEEALIHMDALYSTALRLTQDPRDAEDLVQDAFLRAFRGQDRIDPTRGATRASRADAIRSARRHAVAARRALSSSIEAPRAASKVTPARRPT